MVKRPAFQFYPGDWQHAPELRCCSVGARGCWLEMICIMHQADPYGYLVINGKPIKPETLARMIGATFEEVVAWLDELEDAGVFDRTEEGCIVSRRMVRDEEIRTARASGGKLGGNPNLKKHHKDSPEVHTEVHAEVACKGDSKVGRKVNLQPNLRPTPSSSSSSSSSLTLSSAQPAFELSDQLKPVWEAWKRHLSEKLKPITPTTEEFALMALFRSFPDPEDQVRVVQFSIERKAENLILNGDHELAMKPRIHSAHQSVHRSRIPKKAPSFEEMGL